LVEETGVPRENHRPAASHWQTLLDNVVFLALSGSWTHNISSDSKWPGTIYKFIIIFQHFSLKKIEWQRFFYMKILKKKSERKIAFPWGNFKFPTGKSRLLSIHRGIARKSEIVKY
jgi:aromatic ring-opening dioxygenase catalytic subunit (LigB family)